ncbi:MAG: ornithine carbamoyltransferase [Dehalococcoidales bacterium]|nr:ornithine carbamoyltransferase [Dehalococcoidales bacterium]
MNSKDFLSISDLTPEDIRRLISSAMDMKARGWGSLLSEKVLALLFEKPSLRHRTSFEVAMRQLGGHCIYLSPEEVGLGKRESAADVARVLSGYTNCIAARTFSHQTIVTLARYADIPVINALSDLEHPCQAMADLLTIYEKKGELEGLTLAFIGDGNNVAHSLLLAATLSGMNFRIASPRGYGINEDILNTAREYAAESGTEVFCTEEPRQAVTDADIVYTDVWTSMGQEAEVEKRRGAFDGFQVNGELLSLAREDAIFMHDLPAHRGEEVTDDVMDGERSVVFEQSENKMHLLKALLVEMIGGLEIPLPDYR